MCIVASDAMIATSSSIYLARYPFLPATRDYVRGGGITINDLLSNSHAAVSEVAINRVKLAITYESVNDRSRETDVEILSFPLAVFLVTCISDPFISRRYAVAESERCSALLFNDPTRVVERIANLVFCIRLKRLRHVLGAWLYDFRLDFPDYLSVVSYFDTPSWKMVNKNLYIVEPYLLKTEAVNILKLQVKQNTLRVIDDAEGVSPPHFLTRRLAALNSMTIVKEEGKLTNRFSPEALPSRTRSIYNKMIGGKTVPHFARFTLTSFFLNVNLTRDQILSLFSRLPEFDKHFTWYQTGHTAGRIGRVKKCASPGCRALRIHGLRLRTQRCSKVGRPIKAYYGASEVERR